MNDDPTPDELWLAGALSSVSDAYHDGATFNPRPPRARRRTGTMVLAGIVTAAVVSAAILLPRLATPARPRVHHPVQIQPSRLCQVPLPRSWSAALAQNQTPVTTVTAATPLAFAVAPDGASYFADFYSSSWSGIVEVHRASGSVQRVYQFPSATAQVMSGAFDGHWLVWTLSTTKTNPQPASLMAWNSQTGRVATLVPTSNPFTAIYFTLDATSPAGGRGWLAWTVVPQGVGGGQYFLADLSSGKQRALPLVTLAGYGYFVGDLFVYAVPPPSADREPTPLPSPKSKYGAVSMTSFTATSVPAQLIPELEAVRTSLVSSWVAGTAVWSKQSGTLDFWPGGRSAAFSLSSGQAIDGVAQAGPLVTWTNGDGSMYIADLRSGSFARLPMTWGGENGSAGAILYTWSPSPLTQKISPLYTSSILDVASLPPLPHC